MARESPRVDLRRLAAAAQTIVPLDIPVECGLAAARVGETPAAQLSWLLSFSRRDLANISTSQLLDLWLEIIVFGSESRVLGMQRLEWAAVPKGYTREQLLAQLPDDTGERALRIHQQLREALEQVFGVGGRLYTRDAHMRYAVVRMPTLRGPSGASIGSRIVMTFAGSLEDEFFINAFTRMSRVGDRFRRCEAEGCGTLFVATKTQVFCSTRCAQRVRTIRFRRKNPDKVKDLRHAAYVKAVRKKHPKAKVGRRKRKQ